jgi:hypothetical protein
MKHFIALKYAKCEKRVNARNRDLLSEGQSKQFTWDLQRAAPKCMDMKATRRDFDSFSNVTTQAYLLSRLAQVVNRPDIYQEVLGHSVFMRIWQLYPQIDRDYFLAIFSSMSG